MSKMLWAKTSTPESDTLQRRVHADCKTLLNPVILNTAFDHAIKTELPSFTTVYKVQGTGVHLSRQCVQIFRKVLKSDIIPPER